MIEKENRYTIIGKDKIHPHTHKYKTPKPKHLKKLLRKLQRDAKENSQEQNHHNALE
jgi:hypothetical protein